MDRYFDMIHKKANSAKNLRGMFHVHSNYSYDGDNSIEEIASFFRSRGYHFVCLTEHADDFDQSKMDGFLKECEENSHNDFIVIPGLEYRCNGEIHLLVIGSKIFYNAKSLFDIAAKTHAEKILSIIAHPRNNAENLDHAITELVDGIELWNGQKDSKIVPHYHTFTMFNKFKTINPRLVALGGSDLHRLSNYFPLDTVIPTCALETDCILDRLRNGDFHIQGRYFRIQSPSLTWLSFIFLVQARYALVLARALRDLVWHKGQNLVKDI